MTAHSRRVWATLLTVRAVAARGMAGEMTFSRDLPGNPESEHTITVRAAAPPAHLAHGDFVGDCLAGPTAESADHAGEGGALSFGPTERPGRLLTAGAR